jgi:hypothetical protein
VQHFDYSEYDERGTLLDRETGYLPGIGLRISKPLSRWTLSADLTYHAGDVAYSGQTQAATPLKTRTDQKIVDFYISAAYHLESYPSILIYSGFGQRNWWRDIRGTTGVFGLSEKYSWNYGTGGGSVLLLRNAANEFRLDLRATKVFNPSVRVDFNGIYDTATLGLTGRDGFRISLPWRHNIDGSSGITIEPYYEQLKLGHSERQILTRGGVQVGRIFEPDSEAQISGLQLRWFRGF